MNANDKAIISRTNKAVATNYTAAAYIPQILEQKLQEHFTFKFF